MPTIVVPMRVTCVHERVRSRRSGSILIALLVPAILTATTIRFSVNVPYWDEWEWADLAYHAKTGTLTFAQVLAPHNEHRNTVPNVVFLLLDRWGSWNILHEQLVSLALIIAAQVALWRLVRRTIPGIRGSMAFAAMAVVLCSLGQWENFALGYNIGWNICTAAAILLVALLTARRRSWKHLTLAAVTVAVASFSSGQGLLLGPVGVLAIVLVPRKPFRTLAPWLIAVVAVIALYYTDYHSTSTVKPARPDEALACLRYALAFLGAAIRAGSGVEQTIDAGVMLLAALVVAALPSIVRRTRTGLVRNAPWYAFGLYAILGAIFTSESRVHLGVESAMTSHYVAIALFLQLAIIGLVASSWPRMRGPSRAGWRVALTIGSGLAIGMELHGMRGLQDYAADRHAEIRALQRGDPELIRLAYPYPRRFAHLLEELRAIGDGPFAPV